MCPGSAQCASATPREAAKQRNSDRETARSSGIGPWPFVDWPRGRAMTLGPLAETTSTPPQCKTTSRMESLLAWYKHHRIPHGRTPHRTRGDARVAAGGPRRSRRDEASSSVGRTRRRHHWRNRRDLGAGSDIIAVACVLDPRACCQTRGWDHAGRARSRALTGILPASPSRGELDRLEPRLRAGLSFGCSGKPSPEAAGAPEPVPATEVPPDRVLLTCRVGRGSRGDLSRCLGAGAHFRFWAGSPARYCHSARSGS